MKIIKQSVEFLSMTPFPEQLIELAGRTCYKSESKITKESAEQFIEKVCMNSGHESVMEHASATFRIVTNRYTTHQLVRHRIASYSQESQRYCNYSKDKFDNETSFVKPVEIEEGTHAFYIWEGACEDCEYNYFKMIEEGAKPQVARSVLNSSAKTEIVVTMNFRSWLHFIKLRDSEHAQANIRLLAQLIRKDLSLQTPTIFK